MEYIPYQTTVFKTIGDSLDNTAKQVLEPAVTAFVGALIPVATTGVALYLMVMGYMILTGAVQESFYTFLKQALKVLIVAAFALNADTYQHQVAETLRTLDIGLVQALGQSQDASIYQTLDRELSKGLGLVTNCFARAVDSGGVVSGLGSSLSWAFAGIIVALGAVAVPLIAAINILVAKMSLALVLAVGPLFIMCLMWPVTARFFDSWIAQSLNYVLTITLLTLMTTVAMKIFGVFIAKVDFTDSGVNPVIAGLEILIVGLVLGYLLLQAAGMASGLAGGMSLAAVSMRHLGGLAGAGMKVASALNPNKQKTRLDASTGQKSTQSRGKHLMDGNTVLNPRHRQAVRASLGKNWGKASGGEAKKA